MRVGQRAQQVEHGHGDERGRRGRRRRGCRPAPGPRSGRDCQVAEWRATSQGRSSGARMSAGRARLAGDTKAAAIADDDDEGEDRERPRSARCRRRRPARRPLRRRPAPPHRRSGAGRPGRRPNRRAGPTTGPAGTRPEPISPRSSSRPVRSKTSLPRAVTPARWAAVLRNVPAISALTDRSQWLSWAASAGAVTRRSGLRRPRACRPPSRTPSWPGRPRSWPRRGDGRHRPPPPDGRRGRGRPAGPPTW